MNITAKLITDVQNNRSLISGVPARVFPDLLRITGVFSRQRLFLRLLLLQFQLPKEYKMNIAHMMKQAQQMQQRLKNTQASLAET